MFRLKIAPLAFLAICGCLLGTTLSAPAATVGHWRFEEGGFLLDSSGAGNHLSLVDTVQPIALPGAGAGSGFLNPVPLTQQSNQFAANFGSRAGGFVINGGNFSPESFTIEAFVHRAAVESGTPTTRGYFIASQWNTTDNNRSWGLGVRGSSSSPVNGGADGSGILVENELFLYYSHTGATTNNSRLVGSDFIINPGNDYYIAMAYDGSGVGDGTVAFYVLDLSDPNATLQTATFNVAGGIYTTSNTQLRIGQFNTPGNPTADSNRWSGLIDEMRFSSAALAEHELLIAPEPSSFLLSGLAGCGLAGLLWRRRRAQRLAA